MEGLIAAIVDHDNIAVIVMACVIVGGWREIREQRKLERESRSHDALQCAQASDRQAEAMTRIAAALSDLRVEIASRKVSR